MSQSQKDASLCKAVKEAVKDLGLDTTAPSLIAGFINKYNTKIEINNALVKFCEGDSKRGGELFQAIKPLLTDKN